METDVIELMHCKNCKSYENGECKIHHDGSDFQFQKVNPEDHCASFEEVEKKNIALNVYCNIVNLLKYYLDMPESHYKIIALWIMGTYIYKDFPTFPYLYFNAMRGSGKTRTCKIIKYTAWQADMLASLSEAVLFRTQGTLCIDEFESIKNKDKNALRELLNTAYKRGGKVKRMHEVRKKDEEGNMCKQQIVEEFDTYRPIVMANISGMEEVLGDRCIALVLEKSEKKEFVNLVENFENNQSIVNVTTLISEWCRLCRVVSEKNIIYDTWNSYVKGTTLNDTTTLTTPNDTYRHYQHLFKQLDESNINGRNLELYMPLLLIAEEVGILNEIIEIARQQVTAKKEDDTMESKDILLYSYVATKCNEHEWVRLKEMTSFFRNFIGDDQTEEQWLNAYWLGRALKRLNLIKEKRRLGDGREAMLDIKKAQEKMRMFK